ncbi:hypothetical protein [Hyphomicrobium sp.]|uniref:hypothetical protein n=1 Tax=Hyphomicrobium sp. TaxID=82 RepID=UPI000FA1A77B|nr:hypothetical protein [Hyphomicrobium sp.]MBN9247602.1 hypothetical protein [Hyphomicrobium sp.]RUP10077.1 MAG: hypothetical protein EKK38_06495 [Hyphomicrobium sp.]
MRNLIYALPVFALASFTPHAATAADFGGDECCEGRGAVVEGPPVARAYSYDDYYYDGPIYYGPAFYGRRYYRPYPYYAGYYPYRWGGGPRWYGGRGWYGGGRGWYGGGYGHRFGGHRGWR